MSNITELREKGKLYRNNDQIKQALEIYKELWGVEKNAWNGYFYAQCLRKLNKYVEAREIQDEVKRLDSSFQPIRNETLWLDYNEKIKNWDNDNLIEDAIEIINKTNQNDQYLGNIYVKTVLAVVKNLIFKGDNIEAFDWLKKIDFQPLSNTIYRYDGQYYPSDKKTYFIYYALLLTNLKRHIQYIENSLKEIGFNDLKIASFRKYIIEKITYGENISMRRLALFIKDFEEELRLKQNKSYELQYDNSKTTLISDLGNYEFCPVSYAINETFKVPENETWQKDEWAGEKLHLYERYKLYKKNRNLSEAFADSKIELNDRYKSLFNPIFMSEMIQNNYDKKNTTVYTNKNSSIKGIPDYVFKDDNGKNFVVIEKFTRKISEVNSSPFFNDLVRVYGYINELYSLNISYGKLIYWYIDYDNYTDNNGKNVIKRFVKSADVFHVSNTLEEKNRLTASIKSLEEFKRTKTKIIDADRISFPNKCLNCSVVTHCVHKTGKFNKITLPYSYEGYSPMIIEESALDDLPF